MDYNEDRRPHTRPSLLSLSLSLHIHHHHHPHHSYSSIHSSSALLSADRNQYGPDAGVPGGVVMMPKESPARHDDGARDGLEVKYAVDQVGAKEMVLRTSAWETLSQPPSQQTSPMSPTALTPIKVAENKWDMFFEEGGGSGDKAVSTHPNPGRRAGASMSRHPSAARRCCCTLLPSRRCSRRPSRPTRHSVVTSEIKRKSHHECTATALCHRFGTQDDVPVRLQRENISRRVGARDEPPNERAGQSPRRLHTSNIYIVQP